MIRNIQRNVVITEPRLAQYRVPLYELMKQQLAREGIELSLLVGEETRDEAARGDTAHLHWAIEIPTTYYAGERICWRPIGEYVKDADLVVINQHNKALYNHLLLFLPREFRLAFWDHGKNLQSQNPNGLKERFKRWTTNKVDWWFAYTNMTKDIVAASGFPCERITVLNNAIDTHELRRFAQDVRDDEISDLKASLGLTGKRVGLYLGSLYPDKRLDFLIEAAGRVRRSIDNFELVIIGDGLDREKVRGWASNDPWVHWVGPKRGRDKALYARLGEVMLIPAQVGLVIVDAFVLELPLITTSYPNHSPEVAYLESGVNGLMTQEDVQSYVTGIVEVLQNPPLLESLRGGCRVSALGYTIEHMAHRFTDGILRALSSQPLNQALFHMEER